MATTHHDINAEVDLTFNEKRVAFLRRKQQPQTALQRQKPFYFLLLFVAILCECLDAILTFSGIIHFASTKLNENAYFIFWLIGLAVVLLGFFKHKTMDVFHAQRLDDEFVPKSTYAFMLFFALVSAAATYNVTAPALEYLTKTPALASVDSVSLRFDSLLAADMVIIAKEIETHSSTAKAIHKASSWQGKLDMNSQTKYENALGNKNQATAKKTDIVLARNAEKEAAINLVVAKNDAEIQKHKDWCVSFGSFLAWLFIGFEVLLYPAKWYCKDHEKKEVIEADTKVKALATKGQSVKGADIHTPTNTTPLPSKNVKGKREKVFNSPNIAPSMQFKQGESTTNSIEPKEGDILPPNGKGVARVWIMVNGVLDARTKGQLGTLKAAQGNKESERAKYIQELINKLP
jgi:hypothetical protein